MIKGDSAMSEDMKESLLEVENKLKTIIIEHLHLDKSADEIDSEEEFILDTYGFSSIDALELLLIIEKEFNIVIEDEDLDANLFRTLRSMSLYVVNAIEN